jgi:hypothetical protein
VRHHGREHRDGRFNLNRVARSPLLKCAKRAGTLSRPESTFNGMLWCTVRKSAFVLILALFLVNYRVAGEAQIGLPKV